MGKVAKRWKKWGKLRKVGNSEKLEKVGKSEEKWGKVAKSG